MTYQDTIAHEGAPGVQLHPVCFRRVTKSPVALNCNVNGARLVLGLLGCQAHDLAANSVSRARPWCLQPSEEPFLATLQQQQRRIAAVRPFWTSLSPQERVKALTLQVTDVRARAEVVDTRQRQVKQGGVYSSPAGLYSG